MHSTLLMVHSLVRYFLLIFMLLVIVRSLMGWMNKSEFTKRDDQLSLWLFMFTHTQLLLGILLFFASPVVIFSKASMANPETRYWLVEHNTGMIIAIVLITMGRITMKKLSDGVAKHKRLFIFNVVALVIIVAIIAQSHRGFFSITI